MFGYTSQISGFTYGLASYLYDIVGPVVSLSLVIPLVAFALIAFLKLNLQKC
jgi:ABC-type nitrate/sulfonate/bicarbonate transport system permease component